MLRAPWSGRLRPAGFKHNNLCAPPLPLIVLCPHTSRVMPTQRLFTLCITRLEPHMRVDRVIDAAAVLYSVLM